MCVGGCVSGGRCKGGGERQTDRDRETERRRAGRSKEGRHLSYKSYNIRYTYVFVISPPLAQRLHLIDAR